jgi:urate oxidase
MKLVSQNYGKARVRVCKILREGPVHAVKELTVRLALKGEFASSYESGDNASVVPTDTMKNAVNVLAYHHLGLENEPFAIVVAEHFLSRYSQVSEVLVELDELPWTRLTVSGAPHPHSFARTHIARPFTRLVASRSERTHESGVNGCTLLKTTGSAFDGFAVCEHTTLSPTQDRVLATSLSATWHWQSLPPSGAQARENLLEAMITVFATQSSPSVQATLWQMAQAAFDACAQIDLITLTLPNLHYLRHSLGAFGIPDNDVLLLPTDEPHGQIEATIARA